MVTNAGTPFKYYSIITNSILEVGVALWVAQLPKLLFSFFFWPKNGTFGLKKVVTNAVLPLNYDFIITNSLPEVVVALWVALWVAQLPKLLFFLFFCQINGTFWFLKDSYQCRDTFEVWFHHHKWPNGSGCGAMSGAIAKIAVFLVFLPKNCTFWLKKDSYQCRNTFEVWFYHYK